MALALRINLWSPGRPGVRLPSLLDPRTLLLAEESLGRGPMGRENSTTTSAASLMRRCMDGASSGHFRHTATRFALWTMNFSTWFSRVSRKVRYVSDISGAPSSWLSSMS